MRVVLVTVRLFAQLRERAGRPELELELPEGARVRDALAALGDVAEGLPVVMAVNREYAREDRELSATDELALVPPVSGGAVEASRGVHARVSGDAPSYDRLVAFVRHPEAGAVVTFAGVTREVDRLDYEAYAEMASEQLRAIAERALRAHDLRGVAVEHRIGSVPLGEPSVLVAVSAPHRAEAFAGAREVIDEVKARAPIWKREVSGEEAAWVEGTPPPTG